LQHYFNELFLKDQPDKPLAIPAWSREETEYYEERLRTFLKLTGNYFAVEKPNIFPTLTAHYNPDE
jgi:hypothetical protein